MNSSAIRLAPRSLLNSPRAAHPAGRLGRCLSRSRDREQEGLVEHDPDLVAQALDGDVADVVTVDLHGAAR